jgi:predicted RNA-binding Zn-ribbon protein involved in translation (DUF1610 family)
MDHTMQRLVIPHRWDGTHWTCEKCGDIHPDPCRCRCHGWECPRCGWKMTGVDRQAAHDSYWKFH